ncbi:hypothetical protein [Weissella cibaria]|uniref:hypothetical protein n=1 Tax=Weissella cibaria TaxID=137591 RepID=UPI001FA6ECC5|nr:hypothetical protein [Weissella cibaria]
MTRWPWKMLGLKMIFTGLTWTNSCGTSNPHIYAAGDVANTSRPRITTVGYYEARYAASVILGHDEPITYPAVPVCIRDA